MLAAGAAPPEGLDVALVDEAHPSSILPAATTVPALRP
jgi:hypothetical protein